MAATARTVSRQITASRYSAACRLKLPLVQRVQIAESSTVGLQACAASRPPSCAPRVRHFTELPSRRAPSGVSSTMGEEPAQPIPSFELSDNLWQLRNILENNQMDLPGGNMWGCVVYRTAYQAELDDAWAALKTRILDGMGTGITDDLKIAPYPDDVLSTMDFVFVEDPAKLDGLSREALRKDFFQKWVPASMKTCQDRPGCGGRYNWFMQADEDSLLSILGKPSTDGVTRYPAYVKVVLGWADWPLDDPDMVPDWLKLPLDDIDLGNYIELEDEDSWYHVQQFSPVDKKAVKLH